MTDIRNTQSKIRTPKSKAVSFVLRLVGLGLFVWVLTQVNLAAALAVTRRANPWLVAAGILLAVPTVLARSWRLRLILDSFGVHLTFSQALLIRLVGTAGGDMLPGRAGEAITIAYLQQAGYGLRDPTLTLILDRLFDFVILAVCALAGLSFISQALQGSLNVLMWMLILTAVGFSLAIVILLALRARPGAFGRITRRVIPARWHAALTGLMSGEARRTMRWNASVLYGTAAASLLSFAFLILRGYFLARAVGIGLSLPFLAASMAITTLLQLIPVSNVLGIGTREFSLFYLFGLVGVPPAVTIGFSFLIILALLAQDCIGLVLWWRYPLGTPFLRS